MSLCILAQPIDGVIYADVGLYDGACDPEAMIRNKDFVSWDGKVARHLVPCDYYEQFMNEGENLYSEAFQDFTHFAWFEYQDCEWKDFWVDHNNKLVGQWLLLMFSYGRGPGEFKWFNTEEDAQMFFFWLSSKETQELIHDANTTQGSHWPQSHASKIL